MALRMVEDPRPVPHAAHARIVGPVIDDSNARGRDRGGAHRAGFQRHPQARAGQPFRAQHAARLADGKDLGMGSGVGQLARAVAGTGQDATGCVGQDRPHRNLAAGSGGAGLIHCRGHM